MHVRVYCSNFTSAYTPFSDSISGQESSKFIANGNLILTQWNEFSRECRQFLEFRKLLFLVLSLEFLWAWQVCDCLTRIGKKSYQTGLKRAPVNWILIFFCSFTAIQKFYTLLDVSAFHCRKNVEVVDFIFLRHTKVAHSIALYLVYFPLFHF